MKASTFPHLPRCSALVQTGPVEGGLPSRQVLIASLSLRGLHGAGLTNEKGLYAGIWRSGQLAGI